jgi:DNA-binding GntR family transcriptional regulator
MMRYRTKNELVYEMLKEKILNGELKMGTPLTIRNIAEEFDVSETPVREAIKRLDAESLVKVVPHSGITVSVPSLSELKEKLDIRLVLEPMAMKLFVENHSEDMVEKLEEIYKQMQECKDSGDVTPYSRLDKEFHTFIYENCGNKTLYNLISDLWMKSERTRSIFGLSRDFIKISLDEHSEILQAIKNSEGETAAKLLENHKRMSFGRLLDYLISYYQENGFE